MRFLRLAAVGAALYYFFDRQQGARRRALARDRVLGLLGRAPLAPAAGVRAETEALRRMGEGDAGEPASADDKTLKAKIESEVFREAEAQKGDVNVDVELGVVYLRGQVDDESMIGDLESRVRSVQGVTRIENYLSTPGA